MAPRLLVAHVLDAPAADAVDGLRRALGGVHDRIVPHLTIVPPTNVAPGRLPEALATLAELAAATEPIELHLGRAATFSPARRVCYLEVAGELERLATLAAAASTGPFAPPPGRTPRRFVPHVTLSSHLERDRLEAALALISPVGFEIPLRRLVVLVEDDTQPRRPWQPLADAHLRGRTTIGTGGRALHLEVHELVDPTLAHFVEIERPGHELDARAAERVAVAAHLESELVGLALARLGGERAHLEVLLVERAHRGEGIGTALLARLELEAARRGAAVLACEWAGEEELARFVAGRGYLPAGLASGGEGVLERAL